MRYLRFMAFGSVILGVVMVAIAGCGGGQEKADVILDEDIFSFEYKKPPWLTGHIKESTIETYISNEYREIKRIALKTYQESSGTNPPYFRLVIRVSRTVVHPYESIIVDNYQETGGAHGNTKYEYYNLKNKKDISFEEYLADIGFSEHELLQLVNQRLKDDSRTFDNAFLKSLENFKNKDQEYFWQIHQRDEGSMGITLIFPEYSVASYAVGPIKYSF